MTGAGYLDANLSPADRAAALLEQMTLREKVNQLHAVPPWDLIGPDGVEADGLEDRLNAPPGHVSAFYVEDAVRQADLVRARGETTRPSRGRSKGSFLR
jgi:hypothetical protein